jgi:NitT/TauT family transport system substrate-binding protein
MRFAVKALALATSIGLTAGGLAAGAHAQSRDVIYLLPAPSNQPAFGPWMVAQQRGYYKAAGLNVTFQMARGGVDAAKQVGAGNAPVGGALGDTSILVRSNGIPVRAVAVLGGSGFMQLVLNTAKAKDIAALKGQVITTMAYQDTTFFALLGMLATQGMTKNDVNAQAVGPSNVWKLFADGQSAAMAAVPEWTVFAQQAAPDKHFDIIPSDTLFKSMAQAVVASDDEIKKDPELIQKLVTATLHGWSDIVADPDGSAKDYVKLLTEFQDREPTIVEIFKAYDKYVYPGQPKPGWIDATRLAALQDFYLKQGIIEKTTPVDQLYTEEFVK